MAVTVEARVRESQSFATITCSGSVEIDSDEELPDAAGVVQFLSREGPDAHRREVTHIWSRIEPILQSVASRSGPPRCAFQPSTGVPPDRAGVESARSWHLSTVRQFHFW